MNKRVVLMILDGWGIAPNPEVSAIDKANTPFIDSLYKRFPNTTLRTSGLDVGLPEGQMGNSEVGHMNLGAGRVVYQDLVKLNRASEDGSLAQNEVLTNAFTYAKENNKKVHLMGLVSDGGVHSHLNHLIALCKAADSFDLKNVFIHAFTDGRDCDPKSGKGQIETVEKALENTSATVASIIGRYYAMDRDKRWERVKLAYDLLVHGSGESFTSASQAIEASYANGVTDEFIKPIVIETNTGSSANVEEGDVVLCFNFRTDRGREITMALTQESFQEQNMHPLDLHYVTMTRYDEKFKNVNVMFEKDNLTKTLGEVVSDAGMKQIRIAETEKYPHVTFFFSGGREEEFKEEKRLLVSSPKVATYDLQPEMSAYEVRDKLKAELEAEHPDFVCINFANPDMVGHTGVSEAAVKACETVDECVKDLVETGLEHGYSFIILADHGNSDVMINPDGSVNTAHTTNPVPCFMIDEEQIPIKEGKLGDIAPTICKLMGIEIPDEMSGDVLV